MGGVRYRGVVSVPRKATAVLIGTQDMLLVQQRSIAQVECRQPIPLAD